MAAVKCYVRFWKACGKDLNATSEKPYRIIFELVTLTGASPLSSMSSIPGQCVIIAAERWECDCVVI